jgi:BlaI family transcriptional regulator, penicillinase repressor
MQDQLTPFQLEIMNVVWELGECTVADVLGELQRRRTCARNTVQTMMSRREDKGWLRHRDVGGKFIYRAMVPRERAQRKLLEQVVATVFDGSAEGLVLTLLHNCRLSQAEASRIRKMINEAEKRS